MKIISTNATIAPHRRRAGSIPDGTVFRGKICHYRSSAFLKAYSGVICLENSKNTWANDTIIDEYEPLNVELHILS